MDDESAPTAVAARLREAREYLGFTVDQVSRALSVSPLIVEAIEDGTAVPRPRSLERLSRLYARPVEWLCGETLWHPDADLLRKVAHLTEHDREAVLDFHEFLHDAGPAPKPVRRPGSEH